MTTYIVYTLWALIVAAALYKRSGAAAVYFSAIIAHHMAFGWIDNRWYYVSAGTFDLAAAVVLMLMHTWGEGKINLIALCIVSILFNAVGYSIYINGMDPYEYNIAFILLYLAAIIAVMGGGIRVGRINTGIAHLFSFIRGVSKGFQKGQI